jgi:class 6 POU domain transcription factor
LKTGSHQNFADLLGTENSKKRKRRTSFTPQALEILNEYFDKNSHPSGTFNSKYSANFLQIFN